MPFRVFKSLLSILLLATTTVSAQNIFYLTNEPTSLIKQYEVLVDKGFNIDQVDTLPFTESHPLSTKDAAAYWIKITVANPYPNDEKYRLSLSLPLNYSLFGLGAEQRAGLGVPARKKEREMIAVSFKGLSKQVLYLKLDVGELKSYGYDIHPYIIMEKEITASNRDSILMIS